MAIRINVDNYTAVESDYNEKYFEIKVSYDTTRKTYFAHVQPYTANATFKKMVAYTGVRMALETVGRYSAKKEASWETQLQNKYNENKDAIHSIVNRTENTERDTQAQEIMAFIR